MENVRKQRRKTVTKKTTNKNKTKWKEEVDKKNNYLKEMKIRI
jgi:hypothetical protein